MKDNKTIDRSDNSNSIFDERNLTTDYRTIVPLLQPGIKVLDVGCGTGAITKGIADLVGPKGLAIGIDNTAKFIESGRIRYGQTDSFKLEHSDLFEYKSRHKFDLIVSARTFQWIKNPGEALEVLKRLLVPGGQISILDYDHYSISWNPNVPRSMLMFYTAFLKWRSAAGLENAMAEKLLAMFESAGLKNIQTFEANETYEKGQSNFKSKLHIWTKVAELKQIVTEGFCSESHRLKAIAEYDQWIEKDAKSLIMNLREVRGTV